MKRCGSSNRPSASAMTGSVWNTMRRETLAAGDGGSHGRRRVAEEDERTLISG